LTDTVSSVPSRWGRTLPGVAPAILLLFVAVTIGPTLGPLFRPLFVAGCGAVGWYAWRIGPSAHVQVALFLFAFAPFARRVVDLSAGYDQTGLMLIGPLLAILSPLPHLRRYLEDDDEMRPGVTPMLVVTGCVIYAAAISLFQGDWFNSASGILKWLSPLVYALALLRYANRDEMVQAITSAFLAILPITGLIGIVQYINPPDWDRYWMQFAPISSVGQPLPYEVRVFSSMNGPASFATFTAAGLLLACFLRSRWYLPLAAIPAALALLLSLYRTAWISLAVGVLFCLLFKSTRMRAAAILLGSFGAVVSAATLPPFASVVSERLATLSEGTADSSAQERLDEYLALWNQTDSNVFGTGFTTVDVGSAGAVATDGMIIGCWVAMGIVVGLFCLSALVWATLNMVAAAWRDGRREAIVVGAIGCGALVQLPLANIASGELGFLFWTFAALASLERSALTKTDTQ
jgi:O-Antigen ligase